jgi:ribosomal protein S18 acetylase RimI-like enzyme
MRPMEIRRAVPADTPELVRLRQVMFDALFGVMDTSAGWEGSCAEVLERGLADGSFVAFVVDDLDGGLAACGVGMVAARLPGPGNLSGRYGYIQSMATDPEYRRKGLARGILDALLAWFAAEGVDAVDLHASVEGEPLYRSKGFKEGETLELRWRSRWGTEDGAYRGGRR